MRLTVNYYVPSLRSKFEIKVRIHTYNANEGNYSAILFMTNFVSALT